MRMDRNLGQPTSVLDEGARIYGWTTLFLKRILPATFQRKHFHYKRKTDRPFKEGTVFLTELAKNLKVPLQERKKDELVQVLVDRIATMPVDEIPPEILAQIPPNPWSTIQTKDKVVLEELTTATLDVAKEELMSNFSGFPKSFLELVHHLRENSLFPDESKVVVWMGEDMDSIFILNRNCIMRTLVKKDTKNWALPQPFFDAELPEFDVENGPAPAVGLGGGITPMKRKKNSTAGGSAGGLATSSGSRGNNNGGGGSSMDTSLVAAALKFMGTQAKRASTETAVYWKQKEDIERENAKRARIDSEVHRFKTLEDILPSLYPATGEELSCDLEKQKADFCRKLLQDGKKKNNEGDDDSHAQNGSDVV